MKTFFLKVTCFRPEKVLEFAISGGKSYAISVKTFFLRSPVSNRKILLNLCISPYSLDPDWSKFSCPHAPLEFTKNKLLVPPQNLFLRPQSRYAGAGSVSQQPSEPTTVKERSFHRWKMLVRIQEKRDIWITFHSFVKPFERTSLLRFGSSLTKLN